MRARTLLRCIILLATVVVPARLSAEPVEDFYKGKQVRLIVGSSAGDGYDLWSRLISRHMARHIPGRPGVVVQNMPAAGTRAASATSKAKTIEDVFTQEILVGGIGAGMVPTFLPTMLNKLMGTKFRVVEGYGSTGAVFLAIERGEVDGICMASSTLLGPRYDLIEKGALKILFSMEAKPLALLPDVPTMVARIKTDDHRQIVSFINAALEYGRPFAAPPGVQPERLGALQAAFRATLQDAEFLVETKQMKYQITYTSPDELKELTERMYATPRAIIEQAAAMMPNE